MRVTIVIPALEERENLCHLIPRLREVCARAPDDYRFLIVDDASRDGTADAVRSMAAGHDDLERIEGPGRGLGAAYTRGMRHVLDVHAPDVVMEMDADLSHRPEDVPRLVAALNGCDFVIGSRYVAGGSIPREWPLVRKLNSRLGNLAARFIAGLYSVRDCTGGFRAIRARFLADIDAVGSRGYCFQVDLLHRAIRSGARVREVPIEFAERAHGESKLGLSDQVEFAMLVWRIRLRDNGTFLRFLAVGMLGVFVNLGTFLGLMALGVGKYLASPIAIELSILFNFLLNNYWTFAARGRRTALPIRGLRFNLVSLLALGVSYSTFVLLSLLFPRRHPAVPQLLGIIPATVVNYLLNSYWIWPRLPAS